MGQTAASHVTDHPPGPKRPPVLELLGPAGAGKTTVLLALGRRDETIRLGAHVHRLKHLPFILSSAAASVPMFFTISRSAPRSVLRIMRHMVRLRTFQPVVGRAGSAANCRAVVLDEGPVFTLARLAAFGHPCVPSSVLERCWRSALDQCAETVDTVVWLDAPDSVLAERIRARAKTHRMKNETEQVISQFLARYRTAYEHVISQLTGARGVRLLALSTALESADQVAEKIAVMVDAEFRARLPGTHGES